MTTEEWLGSENQLGMDIWTRKYCNEGEDFEAWVQRISGGNQEIGKYIKEKKYGYTLKNPKDSSLIRNFWINRIYNKDYNMYKLYPPKKDELT